MVTVRRSKTNNIHYDEQSDDESSPTTDDASQASGDSSSSSGNVMEVSDDEDAFSRQTRGRFSYPRSWRKASFKPKIFEFRTNNCGITDNLSDDSPLDLFKVFFFDEDLLEIIVGEASKFQASVSDDRPSPLSHRVQWSSTDFQEMDLFLAAFMLMAHGSCEEVQNQRLLVI